MKLKLQYNSPVILTFTLAATLIMALDSVFSGLVRGFFTFQPGISLTNPVDLFRMLSYVLGHANWEHLIGNFSIILLIGPILEEKYGSADLLLMIVVTALLSSIASVLLFNAAGLGASGVVFMLIMLSSFTNLRSGAIPLTFVLVAALYLGREIIGSFQADNVSQFGHIVGGVVGGLFGFMLEGMRAKAPVTGPSAFEK